MDLPDLNGLDLQQVVMNLLMNAIDATSAVEDRARDVLVGTRLLGAEAVTFVTDSGVGLDPETLGQLFVAFHTTKPDGMGMGLSISRSIVENHQGRLWAEANPGHGATFQFALPTKLGAASDERFHVGQRRCGAGDLPGGRGRVPLSLSNVAMGTCVLSSARHARAGRGW